MAEPRPAGAPTLIQSVQRALRLLRALEQRGGTATAKQLARDTDLPLPTAYHLLRTLIHEGLVLNERQAYVLTGSPLTPAPAPGPLPAQAWVDRLSEELEAAVYYAVYRDGEIRVTAVSHLAEHPPVIEWAGFGATGHAHAVGKAILSRLGEKARADHLDRYPVTPLTRFTVPSRAALERRLAALSHDRPVYEYQEYALGTVCAAVPSTAGGAVATLALSVPADRSGELPVLASRIQARAESVLLGQHFSVLPAPDRTGSWSVAQSA
ncbi:IclR family transcriptional regulator [Streptomyces sp. NPDC056144]|uniref:IclR family transcriptional regulator n=1 Tax=unclassified Streptomyces TaxID=2593676 RepID=UPI0035DEEF1B